MNIEPESSTNIELALEAAKKTMNEYSSANPEHQIAHIFMTDGQATIGEDNHDKLSKLVENRFNNIFVGYGLDHNAFLMKKLSAHKNSDYQFVDDMENTGLVYGESVHQLLYPALKDVEIHVDDGLIYDWETNEWKDKLYINVFVSESEKLYQIKKNKINNVEIKIYGKELDDTELKLQENIDQIPDLINTETNEKEEVDLTKYIYRQKVQELLYIANKENDYVLLDELKKTMKEVFKKMRTYMHENNLLNDPFMKLLCDDISITYKSMDTNYGSPFIHIRQTSQGRQKAYNVGTIDEYEHDLLISKHNRNQLMGIPSLFLKRQQAFNGKITNNFGTIDEYDDFKKETNDKPSLFGFLTNEQKEEPIADSIEDELDSYLVSNETTNCYLTPSILNTMRSFSQNIYTSEDLIRTP
jgi:hypothetical protein